MPDSLGHVSLSPLFSACLSPAAGSGVNVYMLDTGIKFSHQEFSHMDGTPGSRAVPGFSVFGDNNSSDCYGHGTHTAATVGGKHLNPPHSRSSLQSWCPSCYTVTLCMVDAAVPPHCTWRKLLHSASCHMAEAVGLPHSRFAHSGSCDIALHIVEAAIPPLCAYCKIFHNHFAHMPADVFAV